MAEEKTLFSQLYDLVGDGLQTQGFILDLAKLSHKRLAAIEERLAGIDGGPDAVAACRNAFEKLGIECADRGMPLSLRLEDGSTKVRKVSFEEPI